MNTQEKLNAISFLLTDIGLPGFRAYLKQFRSDKIVWGGTSANCPIAQYIAAQTGFKPDIDYYVFPMSVRVDKIYKYVIMPRWTSVISSFCNDYDGRFTKHDVLNILRDNNLYK